MAAGTDSEPPVLFVRKSDSALMRAIGAVLRLCGNRHFMTRYWTTIGRTIYYPSYVSNLSDPFHSWIVEHEKVHVRQWERHGAWLWASYLLFPVPCGLAWFRWRWEREAYMVQIGRSRRPDLMIERVVEMLWSDYAWTWPRSWMRRWFRKQVVSGR